MKDEYSKTFQVVSWGVWSKILRLSSRRSDRAMDDIDGKVQAKTLTASTQ